jgi:regulator of sirC expression with transglutaminase-like and TPR domain
MTPADKITVALTRELFVREVSKSESTIDLARAVLLIGAEEEPGRCHVDMCLSELDRMGFEACERIASCRGSRIEALNRYLFEEVGFRGNEPEYYDPRNSMLHRVLERQTGIPITLSLVYMEVGRRAGLEVDGVGLPGHFIVRAVADDGEVALVDPFNRHTVDHDDCQERLDVIYGGQVQLTEEHFQPVGPLAILARVLGNLKAIYVHAKHYRRALAVVDRILLVSPRAIEERRDRGMLLAQLNRLPEAIAETRSYLNLSPNAHDTQAVGEQLKKMQERLVALN